MQRIGIGQGLDLVRPIGTFHHQRFADFEVIAIFREDLIEELGQSFAEGLGISRHFRKHKCRAIRILVAQRIGSQIPITLLPAKHEKPRVLQPQHPRRLLTQRAVIALFVRRDRILVFAQLAGNILESG